jgi:hypothetical protein
MISMPDFAGRAARVVGWNVVGGGGVDAGWSRGGGGSRLSRRHQYSVLPGPLLYVTRLCSRTDFDLDGFSIISSCFASIAIVVIMIECR